MPKSKNDLLKEVKKSGKVNINTLVKKGYDKNQINKLIADGTLLKVAGLILLA
jgi:hypothetical protein